MLYELKKIILKKIEKKHEYYEKICKKAFLNKKKFRNILFEKNI